ncbi:hypothetical protein [Fulvivirga sedimenti]|uniref:Uncharacterized protein n=1 Tax=Fulvivirga sedimenti TaxID=2879465 RepID=A0A9X1HYE3_9BACT|nr:hypothetical protein [Fulvivirga sedimenti]MCA6079002.1 hypothetical protein [Fulvivirga sedimenti]
MRLLLYIRISSNNLELPPEFVQQMRSDRFIITDIDNQSGKEVIDIASRAIHEAEKCGVLIDIRNQEAPVEKLFPVFKALTRGGQNVLWYQSEYSDNLEKFRLKNSGHVLDLPSAGSFILSFLTD